MERSAVAISLLAGSSGRGSRKSIQRNRSATREQRRHSADRCATVSVVASVIFTFMRAVRLSFAPRIA
ncbi:hypothetical protein [Xanthomonas fragariae]|uniref:hypothetical protein n=1 Tax=Xanthomonas fragariae TaxID=48664 RepID=UPI0022AABB2D|nr:hypothetical protein [Xanthomonas fragariae]WAT13551.1 hypothetical protein OZ429_10015 [Xanthomonas fragariae]